MPLNGFYSWVKYVHSLGVLGFLAAHGASISVAIKLRGERDPNGSERSWTFRAPTWPRCTPPWGSL